MEDRKICFNKSRLRLKLRSNFFFIFFLYLIFFSKIIAKVKFICGLSNHCTYFNFFLSHDLFQITDQRAIGKKIKHTQLTQDSIEATHF